MVQLLHDLHLADGFHTQPSTRIWHTDLLHGDELRHGHIGCGVSALVTLLMLHLLCATSKLGELDTQNG